LSAGSVTEQHQGSDPPYQQSSSGFEGGGAVCGGGVRFPPRLRASCQLVDRISVALLRLRGPAPLQLVAARDFRTRLSWERRMLSSDYARQWEQ